METQYERSIQHERMRSEPVLCNRDCFNCLYRDCIVDGIFADEEKSSRWRDERAILLKVEADIDFLKSKNKKPRKKQPWYSEAKRSKNYYQQNRELVLAKKRKYYIQNKEIVSDAHKKWRESHKAEISEYNRKYYLAHKSIETG